MKVCSVEGCTAKYHAKGMCAYHYKAAWAQAHMEQIKARNFASYWSDPELSRARCRVYAATHSEEARNRVVAWQRANRERFRARHRTWSKLYPEKRSAKEAKRRARKFQATPKWANEFFIHEAYHLARLRTKMTGFKWHVDHIVPLKNSIVCGLHCEANLQVIPALSNLIKHNKTWPDMP